MYLYVYVYIYMYIHMQNGDDVKTQAAYDSLPGLPEELSELSSQFGHRFNSQVRATRPNCWPGADTACRNPCYITSHKHHVIVVSVQALVFLL